MEKEYTITIFTENNIGLLHQITIVFTRRKLNIDSITASESEVKGVYRYTIVVKMPEHQIEKVVKQIEKRIGVLKALYFESGDIIHQEIALYKIANSPKLNGNLEAIVRDNHARILSVDPEYLVIEKVGYKAETQSLFDQLEKYGVLQFARSGRVAISCQRKEFTSYLKELTI